MPAFPHYPQLDQMDCGSTCLRMVAKHYGRSFTAQSLREKAQIGKEGVSLLGIAEAAEAIGFRTLGVKIPFEKFAAEAPLPCIVHWRQNHFVVVHRVSGKLNVENGKLGEWMRRVWGGKQAPNPDLFTHPPASFEFLKNEEILFQTPPAPQLSTLHFPLKKGRFTSPTPPKG